MPEAPSLAPGAALAVLAGHWPWPLPPGAVLVPARGTLAPHRRLAAQYPGLTAAELRGLGLSEALRRQPAGALTASEAWRASLAAALARQPRLLALELPETGLAPLDQQAVLAALLAARRGGVAVLLLTGDLNLAAALAEQAWVAPGPALPLARLLTQPPTPAARALVAAARLPAMAPSPPPPGRAMLALHGAPGLPLSLGAGETLAILGAEATERRQLGLALAGLAAPPPGVLALDGRAVPWPAAQRSAAELAEMQLLLPDHATPLDPRRSLGAALEQRLRSLGQPTTRGAALLGACGLDPALSWQTPAQLSAAQRQRAALALALAADPLVILSLDWTAGLSAAEATELLALLERRRGRAAWLMLGEPLPLAARHAARLAVLHQGRIVEAGATTALLARQTHPATAALVALAGTSRRLAAAQVIPITAAAID
jgi:ABC-type glutathione transport system ATPase component